MSDNVHEYVFSQVNREEYLAFLETLQRETTTPRPTQRTPPWPSNASFSPPFNASTPPQQYDNPPAAPFSPAPTPGLATPVPFPPLHIDLCGLPRCARPGCNTLTVGWTTPFHNDHPYCSNCFMSLMTFQSVASAGVQTPHPRASLEPASFDEAAPVKSEDDAIENNAAASASASSSRSSSSSQLYQPNPSSSSSSSSSELHVFQLDPSPSGSSLVLKSRSPESQSQIPELEQLRASMKALGSAFRSTLASVSALTSNSSSQFQTSAFEDEWSGCGESAFRPSQAENQEGNQETQSNTGEH